MDFVLCYPQLKIVYNYIPKNACSTLKATLARANDGATFSATPHELDDRYRCVGEIPAGWKTLLVLRDPFDRLVSAYLDKIIRPLEPGAKAAVAEIARANGRTITGEESVCLSDFFEWMVKQPLDKANAHWRPQSSLVQFSRYDYVLRSDHLAEDWDSSGLNKIAPLSTFRSHSTSTKSIEVARSLLGIPGHFLYGFRITTGAYPSRTCFSEPSFVERVKRFYKADYELSERLLFDLQSEKSLTG